MDWSYGPQPGNRDSYGEVIRLGEVEVSFVPAGHVLGSAQILLEYRGERVVVSGDRYAQPCDKWKVYRLAEIGGAKMEEDVTVAKVPDWMTLTPEMMQHLIRSRLRQN